MIVGNYDVMLPQTNRTHQDRVSIIMRVRKEARAEYTAHHCEQGGTELIEAKDTSNCRKCSNSAQN